MVRFRFVFFIIFFNKRRLALRLLSLLYRRTRIYPVLLLSRAVSICIGRIVRLISGWPLLSGIIICRGGIKCPSCSGIINRGCCLLILIIVCWWQIIRRPGNLLLIIVWPGHRPFSLYRRWLHIIIYRWRKRPVSRFGTYWWSCV